MDEGRIFINYRRGDSQGAAGRLFDRLLHHFRRDQIFMDVDAIEPGVDFVDSLDKQVSSCRAFIAVIGPGWLAAKNSAGERRLDDPSDYVRIEIESALKRDIRVIPVLVDGASMPRRSDLPASLEALSRRNAVELAHHRFTADCDELALAINRALGLAPAPEAAVEPEPDRAPSGQPAERPQAAAPAPAQLPATGKRSWAEILFSFRGRISRRQFILGNLIVLAVVVLGVAVPIMAVTEQIFTVADASLQEKMTGLRELLELRLVSVVLLVSFWPSWALVLKRLHDIGQGWMTLLVFAALDIAGLVLDLLGKEDTSSQVLLLSLGLLFMLAAVKGVSGPNKYGPDPIAATTTS